MSRKTVNVEKVVKSANTFFRDSIPEFTGERRGVAMLLERILFDTDNYKGFSFTPSEWDEEKGRLRDNHDDTRRVYFV